MQPDAQLATASPNLIPGSENAVEVEKIENPKGLEEVKQNKVAPDCGDAADQRQQKTPKKEERPVLGQQQQGKPSRTDNCHCPEVSASANNRRVPTEITVGNSLKVCF